MKRILLLFVAVIFLLNPATIMVLAEQPAKRYPFALSKVGLDNKSFNPTKNQQVTLSFEINKQADLLVLIYDRLGREVKRFEKPSLEVGSHNCTWNGRGNDGKLACGNVFLYVIEAETKEGEKLVYNQAERTGGLVVKPHEYTFDSRTGKIEYVLPKACMIRLRVGIKDIMLARTIFDWEPRTAGRHTETWDGKDLSGIMNLLKHPALDLNLTCYTLPDNTIIATGTMPPFASEADPKKKVKNIKDPWAGKAKYLHYGHDPRICHEPRFDVSFPVQQKTDAEKSPVVSGIVPIRVELDKRDAKDLINKRFEIMLFVDGTFLFEMEEGSSPFTFHWNTVGFTKGPHIITVNIMSYDDHVGVVTKKIVVGE